MDRYFPTIIVGSVFVIAIVGMYLGWRTRSRRQDDCAVLDPVPNDPGAVLAVGSGLYVATTLFEQPLERVMAPRLGFRSRARLTVASGGIIVELTGQDPFFVARHLLRTVQRATWTIDKAVEKDGLVVIAWRWDERDVESYFRLDGDPIPVVSAAAGLVEVRE